MAEEERNVTVHHSSGKKGCKGSPSTAARNMAARLLDMIGLQAANAGVEAGVNIKLTADQPN